MKTINELLSFYTFEADANDNLFLIDGETRTLVYGKKFYLFEHKGKVSTKSEAQALVDAGEALYLSSYAIVGAIKNYSEEQIFIKENGYGFRTKQFVESVYRNIGYVESDAGWDQPVYLSEPIQIGSFDTFSNSVPIEAGLVENGLWCASFTYALPPDDYCTEQHFFTKKPNENDVLTLMEIREILFDFKLMKLSESFDCWECGRTTHWLDVDGDLSRKISQLKDKYCGC